MSHERVFVALLLFDLNRTQSEKYSNSVGIIAASLYSSALETFRFEQGERDFPEQFNGFFNMLFLGVLGRCCICL
jgi:hypothetical protein